MPAPLDLTYQSNGADVPARLYRTGSETKSAGVLLCPGRFRDIDGLAFLSLALAQCGHVVLATTYRGMDFFSDDADTIAGLDYLAGLAEVDPARLAIVGHSRGGMAALRCAAKDRRVRSVVALAPPTEFSSYVKAMKFLSPQRYEGMIASMGGTEDAEPSRYAEISALRYADQIKVPVLLVCGTQDLHAPLEHARWMYEALIDAGNADCRLEVLDGVGHFFEKMYAGYQFDRIAALTAEWLERTLAGG